MSEVMVVYAGDVWSCNLQTGELQVRGWPPHPDPGIVVTFAARLWIVTRRNVRTEGGRACYFAVLLP